MKKKKFVILTTPHECFDKNSKKQCDLVAGKNARLLKKALKKAKISNKLIKGNIFRQYIDLNRRKSKDTNFHKNLDNELNKNRRNIVIDVHSGDFQNDSLVIFNHAENQDDKLVSNIKRNIPSVRIIDVNNKENYIFQKSIHKNIPAILVEFNNNNNRKKIKNLHKKIVKSIIEL